MHYFRYMRNGTYEIVRKRKERLYNDKGYALIYAPNHPLSSSKGYVYEHRKVFYDAYGDSKKSCEKCGKDWGIFDVYRSHIDHIDEDKLNNSIDNLRPLCNACNTERGKKPAHMRAGAMAITWNGETKTPNEWANDDRVNVSRGAIVHRLKRGMSVEDALFSEKITHKQKLKDLLKSRQCN